MKSFLWIPIAFFLLPAAVCPQALPDAPAPAPSNPMWYRIQQISDGQQIDIRTTSGDKVRCRFAGATDLCIFCDPPGSLSNQPGFRFDRASVVSVRESQPEGDLHPGLLAAMAIAGTVVGLAVSRNTSAQGAALAGLLTFGMVGAAGYSMAQMQSQNVGFGIAFQSRGFARGAGGPHGGRPRMPIPIRPMRLTVPWR
jgi:hypothetical protein